MTGRPHGTKQYEVLEAIREFKDRRGFSPTMRDLMFMTDITSLSVVSYYLGVLEREGMIRREPHLSRSIELVGAQSLTRKPASKKFEKGFQKIDQRKYSDRQTVEKKRAAAVRSMGEKNLGNAFIPREKTLHDPKAAEHLEEAVALGKANDAAAKACGESALINRLSLFPNGRVRGSKVG